MHIAFVCMDPGVPVFGKKGSAVHVQEVVRALLRKGIAVTLLARRTGGRVPSGLESACVQPLPRFRPGAGFAGYKRAVGEMNRNLEDRLERLPSVDAVYERHSLWSYAAMRYARRSGIPGLLEVNAPLVEEQVRYRALEYPDFAQELAQRAFRDAALVVAVSEEVSRHVEKAGVSPSRIAITPNGVDPDRFRDTLSLRNRSSDRPFTVGFLGSLKPWHGVETLTRAFARVRAKQRESRLLIVGDGPSRESVESEATRLRVSDAVEFSGAVDPSEVPSYLARMDVGVAPYCDRAGFYFSPLKVFEYMAAGLPTVASRVGQLTGLIEDGPTGLLCGPGNVDELAAAILFLEERPALRGIIGGRARKAAVARHGWDARVSQVLERAASAPKLSVRCDFHIS